MEVVMTRKEYMDLLSRALENMEPEVARDIMEDYEAHFERANESGRSDEEVIEELGSIEEFKEELAAFMTGKVSGEKKSAKTEDAVKNRTESDIEKTENADILEADAPQAKEIPREEPQEREIPREEPQEREIPREEPQTNEIPREENGENREQQIKYDQQVEEELNRARDEMNRAYEEMMRAKEEMERATKEAERARKVQEEAREREKQARQEERTAGQRTEWEERTRQYRTHAQNQDFDSIISGAKNIASTVLSQVSSAMDKAFSGLGDCFSSFEKSGEDMADYRRRQENAKSEAESYQREGQKENSSNKYSFSDDYDNMADPNEEQYMPECNGIVTENEGIRHIVVDSKSADVEIYPSKDLNFVYHYVNEGSAGSKIIYRCERKVSQGTMTLNIVRSEKAGRKNHSSILGGVFEENPDLRLTLYLPEWMEALEVNGKSGDIKMRDTSIRTLMLKSMSGDISLCQVDADKCMAESMSGDVEIKDGSFDYVLAASKSGDASGVRMKAEKAAFKSMSGDAQIKEVEFGEVVVSSMSGDAEGYNSKGGIISVSSMSGDAYVRELTAEDAKISAQSGDAGVEAVRTDRLLLTAASGDLEGKEISAKILKASAVSGDMSVRGHADQMSLNTGSGDVVVVHEGDTKASITTRSGEVNFHLKNNGAGFAAKVSSYGSTKYNYADLHLSDAANGIHRYGREGSSLEIKSTSGDITITD